MHPIILGVSKPYHNLPSLYLTLSSIWCLCSLSWAFLTWQNCHIQTNNLQWMMASVHLIKILHLLVSFLLWYSCFYSQICSLWTSFGVYVTGVLFQTASFVSLLLIAHGYCIMCENLLAYERQIIATLGCIFYLTFVGYRASVPYITGLLLLNYFISFSMIFHHISQNLLFLREQLSVIEDGDDDVRAMLDVVHSKFVMFKKFRVAMQLIALAEAILYINVDDSPETYLIRLLIREWAQICIYFYIWWTCHSQDLAPHFSVIPTEKTLGASVSTIYRVVMDAATYKDFCHQNWHIGVPISVPKGASFKNSSIIVVQQPKS